MTTTVTGTEEVMSSAGDRVQYLPCSIDFTGTTQIQQIVIARGMVRDAQ